MKQKFMKEEKGITLIGFIIALILLLIIVGVIIGILVGENEMSENDEETQSEISNGETTASNLTEEELEALEENEIAEMTDDEITNENLKGNENIRAVITGEVPIPTDATYIEGTKETGVVVEIAGSQFVWVPVEDINTMARETSGTDANGRTNYQGVLYDFDGTTSTEMEDYGQGTTSNREPDVLSDYDGGSEDTVGITEESLQEEYNAMVESVAKYGGFFVGRYESSISGNMVASVSGATPMSIQTLVESGILEHDSSGWYAVYKLEKEYSSSNNLTSVQSSMIWGSQYDAMINWMLTGSEAEKVAEEGNGNHSGEEVNTGATETDKINNIYDLEGNLMEWTLEAEYTNARVTRGGYYDSYSLSSRSSATPGGADAADVGSRLTLYIQ